MKKQYIWILLIFFLFVGPGPTVFFLNNYTVALFPPASLIAVLWLLKDELVAAHLNRVPNQQGTYQWAFEALKYSIFAHAATTLMFRPQPNLTETLLGSYLVMPFYVVAVGPVLEEIAYRKIIFGALARRFNFWTGALVSSAIFTLGHFSWDRALGYFAVGLIFCHVYRRCGSIVPTMMAHSALNLISLIVGTLRG